VVQVTAVPKYSTKFTTPVASVLPPPTRIDPR